MDDVELEQAREAFARRDWRAAHDGFVRADALDLDDLGMLARTCWWLGEPDDHLKVSGELHQRQVRAGQVAEAAMTAMQIGFTEFVRGHDEVGAGWLARAHRHCEDAPDAAAHGYLAVVAADAAESSGDLAGAAQLARQAMEVGERHEDASLQAMALFQTGVLALRAGRTREGLQRLDEAMLPVRAGEVAPEWAGNVYCRMMQLCHELGDYPRAQHWTAITEDWCRDHEPAVLFSGICRVHRVQLLQVRGEWQRAAQEAQRAADDLDDLDAVVVAEAHYRLGEVRRLWGDLDGAEAAYRDAHHHGRDPLPGLALLHHARGRRQVAASLLDAALAVEEAPLRRAPLLAARAEVALSDPQEAEQYVDDLASIAERHASPGWCAEALQWRGAALLAAERYADAARVLQDARERWLRIDAPYHVARVRSDLADAYDALGDHDTADREREEAAATLTRLEARRDLDLIRSHDRRHRAPGDLSPRELEVLAAIASGETNRDAADRLHISERTVQRHLANVYLKAAVSSRTGAVAWARERGLL